MKIRINENNKEKIANAIIEVEGTRVRERKLSATQVLKKVEIEREILKTHSIALKLADGYAVEYDVNAQRFAKAYDEKACHGQKPQSTHFSVTWVKGVPYLTDVTRANCWTTREREVVKFPEPMKEALIKDFEKGW